MIVQPYLHRTFARLGYPISTAYKWELNKKWKIPLCEESVRGNRSSGNQYKQIRRHFCRTTLVITNNSKINAQYLCNHIGNVLVEIFEFLKIGILSSPFKIGRLGSISLG